MKNKSRIYFLQLLFVFKRCQASFYTERKSVDTFLIKISLVQKYLLPTKKIGEEVSCSFPRLLVDTFSCKVGRGEGAKHGHH